MRIAINTVTIKPASLEEKMRAAEEAGFEGIGLWRQEVEEAGPERVKSLLRRAGLLPVEICATPLSWTFAEDEGPFEESKKVFELAERVGCKLVVAPADLREGPIERAAENYAKLCELAEEFGVTPALEFLGGAKAIRDLASARKVVEGAGRPNGKILVDTFHFHKGGSSLADLRALPGEMIGLVHVNDVPSLPHHLLEDRHRVMPGEGSLDLPGFLSALASIGYEGFLSLELFNEDYWREDPMEVAARGAKALLSLLRELR